MKLEIEITQKETGFLRNDRKICEITVKNGNWKYWEDHMEEPEKQSLTINNLCTSHYLNQPVKDVYSIHDHEAFKETRQIITKEASVRTYDSLLEYLNFRINNVKEEYCNGGYHLLDYDKKGGVVFKCVLFEEEFEKMEDVVQDIVYECKGLLEVRIEVIE